MNKYILSGFIKEAKSYGIEENDAINLFKIAVKHEDESSYMGRFMNYSGHRIQNGVEHPIASLIASLPGGSLVDGLPLMAGAGGTEEGRNKELKKQQEGLSESTYTGNAAKGAVNMGIGGGLGGTANGAISGMMDSNKGNVLKRMGTHGIGGLAAGAGGGAILGLLSKAINKHTSHKSQESARDTLAKHPLRQSLPFADLLASTKQ